ncbi:MAG: hypothetical protein HZA49_00810 [Planctomycetes bacterium]|nr:hypothetical protein [Planctomycetota bacterium]
MTKTLLIVIGILAALLTAAGCASEPKPQHNPDEIHNTKELVEKLKDPNTEIGLPVLPFTKEQSFLKSIKDGDVKEAYDLAGKIFKPGRKKSSVEGVLKEADTVIHNKAYNENYYYFRFKRNTGGCIIVDVSTETRKITKWKYSDK